MVYVRIGLGLAALAAASIAGAQAPSEWLGQAPLPELVIGFQRAEARGMIVERIPPGETVEQWSRMVTVQRFAGVIARGGTLDEWRGHFLDGLRTGCPGYRVGDTVFRASPVAPRSSSGSIVRSTLRPAGRRPSCCLRLRAHRPARGADRLPPCPERGRDGLGARPARQRDLMHERGLGAGLQRRAGSGRPLKPAAGSRRAGLA